MLSKFAVDTSDPNRCSIRGCRNSKSNSLRETFTLHGFPNDNGTKDKWLEWIAGENGVSVTSLSNKRLTVCGDHFAASDKGIKKLRKCAVPTISAKHNVHSGQDLPDVLDNIQDVPSEQDLPLFSQNVKDVSIPSTSVCQNVPAVLASNSCCLITCKSKACNAVLEGFRMHRLPKDVNIRNQWCKWIAKINNVDWTTLIGKKLFLCSKHFADDVKGKVKLKSVAIPTINDLRDKEVIDNEYLSNGSKYQSPGVEQASASEGINTESSGKGSNDVSTRVVEDIESSGNDVNEENSAVKDNGFPTHDPYAEYSAVVEVDMNISSIQTQDFAGTSWNFAIAFGQDIETVFIEESLFESKSLHNCNISCADKCSNSLQLMKPNVTANESNNNNSKNMAEASTQSRTRNRTRKDEQNNKKKCFAKDCHPRHGKKYFKFPATQHAANTTNLERCKIWVKNSGNKALLDMPTSSLHSKCQLCEDHFSNNQFYNADHVTLLQNAIPTLFSHNSPLTDEDMKPYPVLTVQEKYADVTTDHVDNLQRAFEEHMNNFKWITCATCNERFYVPADAHKVCKHSKNVCPSYSKSNDMDPGDVPPALQGLTYVEEQLIARVHPLISVFKLKGNTQFGYRGNIINFPQEVNEIAIQLPHRIENLPSLITIRTSDKVNPIDFHVRAGKVKEALMCLKEINPYYKDVEFSSENWETLPEDGNVFERVTTVIDDCNSNDVETDDSADEDSPATFTETCVPMMGEASQIEKASAVLNWPHISKDKINEFTTVGYVVMAFPSLFPYGYADLRIRRQKSITPISYFQHLMNYKDDRFAKHPRFRYFALNSIMRWSAIKNGGIFVRKNSEYHNMKKDDLKTKLDEDPSLIRKMMFYNSNLRATKAYWYARGQELLAMVRQLGLPTLFFTLSAADIHWPDLFKFLCPDEDPNLILEARRRKLIEENPAKVDAFFMERADNFVMQVLKQKFKVNDLWYRIEYQHRGSPHVHGVLWLDGAPEINDLSKASEEEIESIVKYFDKYISTEHPDPGCPPGQTHPCRIRLSEVLDVKQDLAHLLNRVQRHTKCSESYCLRKNKKTKKIECRFKFPKDFCEHSELLITNETDIELRTTRNDRYLNKYNDYMIQTWRANIDVSPVMSKRALVAYLAKYISKSETQSNDLSDILKSLLNSSEEDASAKSIIQRLYIQCCSERDFSAQETCHLLSGLPLCKAGGRKFVNLNFKVLDSVGWVPLADDEANPGKSFIQKYMERPARFQNETLMHLAKLCALPSGKRHCHGKEAIVQVFPRLAETCNNEKEPFYRQQVLLHVPWRYEDQFLQQFSSWEDAYKSNEMIIKQQSVSACDLNNIYPDEPEYEEAVVDLTTITDEFMYVAKMGPSQHTQEIELGRRDLDKNHDWQAAREKYQQFGDLKQIKSFVRDHKRTVLNTSEAQVPTMPQVEFTVEQKAVLKVLYQQMESLKTTNITTAIPKSVIVQGKAGTGKSLLIHAMVSLIHEQFGKDACVLLGPTGVSALNINGSTIHSKLNMQVMSKERATVPLKSAALHEFREKFQKTHFVLIDEYSMVGCNLLNNIDRRLKEAKDKYDLPYGGVFVYIFGDVQQLAPVGDCPVYSNNQKSKEYIDGKLLYKNIDAAILLSQVKRQNNIQFQNVLNNLSTGHVTREDYEILKGRFRSSLSDKEKLLFKDAIRLYPTRKEVEAYNCKMLQNLVVNDSPVPVARVPARHNISAAIQGTENEGGGLRHLLYLAPSAKIMLRANLWTEKGLVNGAIGMIVDILYEQGCNPPDDPPVALICTFETYKGPYLNPEEKTVVIEPLIKKWKNKKGQDCVREQFPISLCYACSVHKSQGLTLEKAVVNIGPTKEMCPGLTYTALSRVKALSGLMLEDFGELRLRSLNDADYVLKRAHWLHELSIKAIQL